MIPRLLTQRLQDRLLRVGALPGVYLNRQEGVDILSTYATVYLREEIGAEAVVRKLGSYARFLDFAAQASGQWINYAKFASDSEINKETVRRYFTILEDTLIAFRIPAYRPQNTSRRVSQRDRFVFFDVGVRNALLGLHHRLPTATESGSLFEQWLIVQIIGYARVHRQFWRWCSYRTDAGAEVDFIIDIGAKLIALAFKWATTVSERACRGLRSFVQVADKPVDCYVISRSPQRQRFAHGELALGYQDFLGQVLPGLRTEALA